LNYFVTDFYVICMWKSLTLFSTHPHFNCY